MQAISDTDFAQHVRDRLAIREGETFDHALEEYVGVAVANAMAGEFERGIGWQKYQQQAELLVAAEDELRSNGHTMGCPTHAAEEWIQRYARIVSPSLRRECVESLVRLFVLQRSEEAKGAFRLWERYIFPSDPDLPLPLLQHPAIVKLGVALLKRVKTLDVVLRGGV